MVKGISRRVIVVRAPDPRFFEQAIFLLKEDAGEGVSGDQIVAQARQAAAGYVRRCGERSGTGRHLSTFPWWMWFSLGACATGAVWLMSVIV